MKTIRFAAAVAVALFAGATACAQEGEGGAAGHDSTAGATPHYPLKHPHYMDWSFSGPFGKFDPQQLQRGFQVYREVCSACHALSFVAFRTLADEHGPHFTEEQAAALAAEYQITDGPDESGEMFERPGRASDLIPSPFPNEQAARASNNGAYPPDLSLVAKNRAVTRGFPAFVFDIFTQYQEAGPDYIYSLLTGYEEPPAGVEVADGQYYNPYFVSGPSLAMPPPLVSDGQVTYAQNADETQVNDVPETIDQYAKDVTAFLMWAAEPHMVERKSMGLTVVVFLIILAGLVYYTKKKVWAHSPGEGAA
jgi:ubiquinol-cytochrome c reductase cytochrome c1 subunit